MIIFPLILFWVLSSLVVYTYVIYPILLFVLNKLVRNDLPHLAADDFPFLYVVFSAFNEEKVIEEKLNSIFSTSYPLDRIRIYVGSDCSTDDTNRLIADFAGKYSQLIFFPFTHRQGKSGVINSLMQEVRHHAQQYNHQDAVVILTDANVMFTADLFYTLTRLFRDTRVGLVAAKILNRGVGEGISVQENLYIRLENYIKFFEGRVFGAMQGAFGACYAIRVNLIPEIPPRYLMEDFYISMYVLRRGFRSVASLQAICYEDLPGDMEEEYKRKRRISAGNWQNLAVYWPLLFRPGVVSFCFWSHKVIRWITPFFLLLLFPLLSALAWHSTFYSLLLLLYLLFTFSPLIHRFLLSKGMDIRWIRYPAYFVMMQLALVEGFRWYVSGISGGGWTPTARKR